LGQPDSGGADAILEFGANPTQAGCGLVMLLAIFGGVLVFTSLVGQNRPGLVGLAVGVVLLSLALWQIWRGWVTSVQVKTNGDIHFRSLGRWRVVNVATMKRISLSERTGSVYAPVTLSRVAIYYGRVGVVLVRGYPQAVDLARLILTMNLTVKTKRKLRAAMNQG
jgi:uncharacterized membrane protein YjgN (DUF898 family)